MILAILIVLSMIVSACSAGSSGSSADFPSKDINGTIQWGEGGPTDVIARAIANVAEETLDTNIILTNRLGASGAIATQYVYDQKADGYDLLFGAENPALYPTLGISERSLRDFYPVILMGTAVQVISVPADSPFDTIEELLEYAKENPKKVSLGVTGPGGAPDIIASMMEESLGVQFNKIPFDGNGPAMTAMLGGHVDVTVSAIMVAEEYEKNGDIKILTVFNNEKSIYLPDVTPIGDVAPELNKYFPWASFFGVWAKKDTPQEVLDKLVEGFKEAYETEEFQAQLEQLRIEPIGIHGEEADEYIERFSSITNWLLYDIGVAEHSPEEFDIPRIEE
ncbi:tripartite tricarboxylate transporter substrate binding protein [Caldifermentibacillus hisashii]|uniref:Bug family tripartite tricarboxylate transporter substrate binding protein n=1 Tax=Caldifermentibacillus hisashii TaxID=996558 RepID=UPI0031FBA651